MIDASYARSTLREWLAGRGCLKSTVNVETGSDLLLQFGRWIPYERRSERLKVTHRGEFMLMINCVWEISGPRGAFVDSGDVHDREPWQDDHTVLEGLAVRDVELVGPSCDLTLLFEGGFQIRALCETGEDYNWSIVGPHGEELGVDTDCRIWAHPSSEAGGA